MSNLAACYLFGAQSQMLLGLPRRRIRDDVVPSSGKASSDSGQLYRGRRATWSDSVGFATMT